MAAKKAATPYVPPTDDEQWTRALQWAASGNKGPLHSKQPREAPPGFVRVKYLSAYTDEESANFSVPNYVYVRPETIKTFAAHLPVTEPAPLWNGGPLGRQGPYIAGDWGTCKIDIPSVELLKGIGVKPWQASPVQGSFFE